MKVDDTQDSTLFAQSKYESALTLALYLLFFIWWVATTFLLGAKPPNEYSYIFGMPSWFFLSCILGWIFISFILWIAVKFCFKSIPLDSVEEDTNIQL